MANHHALKYLHIMKRSIYLASITILSLSACKKEDEPPPVPPIDNLPVFNQVYGGSGDDAIHSIIMTSEGYLVAGESESSDGDVGVTHGNTDAWILKLDKSGNKQWQKVFGGTEYDVANCVVADHEEGYVIVGGSLSFDGDLQGNGGHYGAWAWKIDRAGNVVWGKILGESKFDFANAVTNTKDGGYLVTGFTSTVDEDVDAWVTKLDKSGSVVWQKIFGGIADDKMYAVVENSNGDFLIAGTTESKDDEFAGNHGASDVWILKLGADGTKLWQKVLGGVQDDAANAICATADGGYVIAGLTASNNGDVSENKGSFDAWIIKLDNKGNKKWQRTLGGSDFDNALTLTETKDHDLLIGSYTNSMNGDVQSNHGKSDVWMIRMNQEGGVVSRTTYGGTDTEFPQAVLSRPDKSFVVAGVSRSNNGDVPGNRGGSDGWIFTIPHQ
jgi:hypothetical protein